MKIILIIFLQVLAAFSALADEVPDDIVTIKDKSISLSTSEGDLELNFEIEVVEGFFAYQDKFEINIKDFSSLDVSIDPVVSFFDKTFQKTKKGVRNQARFKVLTAFSAKQIPKTIDVELVYQACTPEYCLFPTKTTLTHDLTDSEKADLKASLGPGWLKKGLFLSILFVFLAGFLTSLTPCVYPMLPITIAVLGANKSTSRLDGFVKSLTYVLGMALTYASLGMFAASTGFMFGSLLSNSYFLGFLSILLFLGALSMFDAFEIQTPAFLRNRIGVSQKSTSYVALFVTGLFSGLMVGPCVGPVLVGILGYVSQTGSLVMGFSLLFSFALGLGSLILVLGTFSDLMDKIPRSGNWMNWVKKLLGLIFLGLIAYFLTPVLSFKLLIAIVFLTLLVFSLILLVKNRSKSSIYLKPIELAVHRSVVIFSALAILVSFSLSNERLERLIGYSSETFANTHWDVFSEEKLEAAKANGQYVVLDFYAEWCAACRELKHETFSKPEISNFSPKIKWMYFDSTKNTEKLKELKKKYNILGLPTILFFNSDGALRDDIRLTGFEGPELFLERLKKLTKEGRE
jgi:thiol:disulfide interchange protein DsbD